MFSFIRKDSEIEIDRAASPINGVVFQMQEVEALMAAAEDIALNIKSRIDGASQVIFKNLKQEHQFEAFTESIGAILNSIISVQEQLQEVHSCTTALEGTAGKASSSVEQITDSVNRVANIVTDRISVTSQLTDAVAKGSLKVKDLFAVIDSLNQNIDAVKDIIGSINNVSAKTNLLAMNAAIEAAHAGEAGKGFAVVADEIRKLAEESSTQGKTITSTLKVLSGEIEALSASSKTAEEKFNAIFALSEQVKTMSQNLMEAMREQENGSKEVLSAIRDINTVTNQVNDGSAEMLRGGENVAQEMQKLDNLTRIITDSMNEMASGAVQITNAMQEVNEISQKNKASIQNLAEEVGKFKV